MSELKPCPFCGSEAITHLADSVPRREMLHGWYVACVNPHCMAKAGFYGEDESGTYGIYEDEAEATDAWNTRAERTCHWEYPQGVNGWIGYMVCSCCGAKYDETVTDEALFCPNCGAKVVS